MCKSDANLESGHVFVVLGVHVRVLTPTNMVANLKEMK